MNLQVFLALTLTRNPALRRYTTEETVYRKTILDSGIRVVSETIPYVRSVSVGVWANVGSRDEDEDQNGISHFLEHMVFKGTRKRSVKEIAQSLESVGGFLNAFTTKEQTCFYARVLDERLPKAIDVLSDLLQNATFNGNELEREKTVVIEELKNGEDDPEDLIHDHFERILFPRHSLGYPIIGTEKNLRAFTRKDLFRHVEAHYGPANMVLAAAGNVDHEKLVELVDRSFRNTKSGGNGSRRRRPRSKGLKPVVREINKPITQAHVCLGTIAYSIHHKDRYSLLVLNALLGDGMSSRLYQTLRERHGLAYSVYSFISFLSDAGVFGAYIGTDKNKVDSALKLIYRELRKLRDRPVSKAELERTKSQIKGTMMLGLENMSGRMMRLGTSEIHFGQFVPLDTVLSKVDGVTPESMQRVANDLFVEENFSTVFVRPGVG